MIDRPLILLVEDDKSIAEVMKLVLENEGYQVLTAMDNAAAIRALTHRTPKLVLLDYQLDGETVESFVHVLKEKLPTVPVMLVTARSHPEALADALRIKNLIKKPFLVEELTGAIRALINSQN